MKRQEKRRKQRDLNSNSNWIPIEWKRTQIIPREGKYLTLDEFFNAMHSEYIHKIENDPAIGNQHMALYMDKNYIQQIEFRPTEEQNHMVKRFMQVWIKKYKPKYFFRMNGLLVYGKEALGFIATEPNYDPINVLPEPQKEKVYWVTRDDSNNVVKLEPMKQHKGGYFLVE